MYQKVLELYCQNKPIITPFEPSTKDFLCKTNKGCKIYYSILLENVTTSKSSFCKWNRLLNFNISLDEWHNICVRPFKITHDTKLQWFQYRITNNIIATNSFLYKIKIKNEDLCTFCKSNVETICHLFCQCIYVKSFWKKVERLLTDNNRICVENNGLTDFVILLGFERDELANVIILLAKFHIYRSRVQDGKPNFHGFVNELIKYKNTIKYIAISNMKIQAYDQTWGKLKL